MALAGVALLAGPAAQANPSSQAQIPETGRHALVVELDTAIDNVSARFLSRVLDSGDARDAELVIIRIDTPGGLVDSTRDMVEDIFESPTPVAVFVAPGGARAASAGTFITAAGGVAAMAPGTNIGAASVVGGQGEDLPETLAEKATQDAVAFMRSIAEERGRNVEALTETVLEATAFSAGQALEAEIIDVVAADVADLLEQLDGTTVPVRDGETTLDTGDLALRSAEMGFFDQVLSFLSNPNIAFLLVSLGGLALVVELWSPGLVGPGVIGVLMLISGFAGVGQLPFSWGGVALILLAMVLFFLEAQAPGFGVFGAAGTVSLILGGLFLVGFFGTPEVPGSPSVTVSRWILIGTGISAGLVMVWVANELRRARRLPGYVSPVARERLVGQTARVTKRLSPKGEVHVAGEFWEAELPQGEEADEGQTVVITGVDGYRLNVEPVADVPVLPKAEPRPVDRFQQTTTIDNPTKEQREQWR